MDISASTLQVIIAAKDEASAALAKIGAELDALGAKTEAANAKQASMQDALKGLANESQKTGKMLTASVTVPILAIAGASAYMGMQFQQNMTYIRTQAGDTTDSIATLSKSVLDLAKNSQFGPNELAQGLYHIASLGMRGADAMNALNIAQQLATVGGANLEDTTSALGGAIVTGIKGVQDYSMAAGTLNAIVGAGNMRMNDLVGAIGTGVLPAFKNAGLSLNDFGAALATLTDNGQSADAAATHLRMTVALMESPSKQAQGALKAIGMESNQLGMDMQTKGLIPALQDLKKHLEDTYGATDIGKQKIADALNTMFGGGRSSAAIQTLLDEMDRVQSKYTQISTQGGQFAQSYADQQQTAAFKIKNAWSKIQVDAINLGGTTLPLLANAFSLIVNAVTTLVDRYDRMSQAHKSLIDHFLMIAVVVGPALFVFGKVISTIMGIGKAIDDLKTIGSGIGDIFGGIASKLQGAFKMGGKGAGVVSDWLGNASDVVTGWAKSLGEMAKNAATTSVDMISSGAKVAAGWAKSFKQMVQDGAKTALEHSVSAVKAAGSWIKAAHDSEIGLGGTLIKMVKDTVTSAAKMVAAAWSTSVAWIQSTAKAAYQASLNAVIASAAWVKNAAIASYAWVTQELPKIIASFVATSLSAGKQALISSAVWVKNAAIASAAWVAETGKIILAQIAVSISAIKTALIAGAQWVLATLKLVIYEVALDATKTATFLLGGVTAATGLLMAGVFAGLVIDIMLVYKAIQTVIGAFDAVKQANAAAKSDKASMESAHQQLVQLSKTGTSDQKARANYQLQHGLASGANYAMGGRYMVGEEGPEILDIPHGSRVYNAQATRGMMQNTTNHSSVTIGQVVLSSKDSVTEFFKRINQDDLLTSGGLTPNMGIR